MAVVLDEDFGQRSQTLYNDETLRWCLIEATGGAYSSPQSSCCQQQRPSLPETT